jgi:hypothetical protein
VSGAAGTRMGGQPPIRPFDAHRFLVGNDPWGFLFEVAARGIKHDGVETERVLARWRDGVVAGT